MTCFISSPKGEMFPFITLCLVITAKFPGKYIEIHWSFENIAKLKKLGDIDLTLVPARSTTMFRLK